MLRTIDVAIRFVLSPCVVALGASGCGTSSRGAEETTGTATPQLLAARPSTPDVLLVHGAWADGSSWSGVIDVLQDDGLTVHAVQLREQSLGDDAAIVRHAIARIARPVVVVGHSYGGAVISEATTGAQNVVALVFVAAFALDQGESIASVSARYPTPPVIRNLIIDDQGNATIEADAFVRYFAADVPRPRARVMSVVQHPIAVTILGTPAGAPGWRTIPSFYEVSTDDQAVDPALERFFAKRMGAETIELRASHVAIVSHPAAIAELIERGAGVR